ncbi:MULTISPECIES: RNA pyrophosphohydrolase [Roseobacteraceae]|jgi:putative (di)nucleoside polyphosphate hydrolase|uniref:RNA pyrophosphohydrolase n=1 Tax=Pseudosulfitobacter pseudonitzschiae TaxID=1402135 RepID=A0A221K5U5_9RHOB|nr:MULTISPECIES: RNA pyrophosphohydrolase [Roseobacteraceae]ASM74233.1 RNA pyrophosphohydrolase [Pseudosulfitobacter pseudonitzschiae]
MTPEEIDALPYRRNVGVMLVNADGHVWVGQRHDRFKEFWQMPQGGVDEGEDARAAALRELEEETGVPSSMVEVIAETGTWLPYNLPHDVVPNIWGGKYRGQEQKWFLLRFKGVDADVNIQTEKPEFVAWKWIDPDAVVAGIVPFKRDVYAAVLAEFKPYL